MRKIPRYDEDFYNCAEGHYVSYWKSIGVPVEYLCHSAFEHSQSIYEHFIVNQSDRWKFYTKRPMIEDIHFVGLQIHKIRVDSFKEAEPIIVEQLNKGDIALLFINGYYYKHRVSTYMQKHEAHCMFVTELNEKDEKKWFIQDHAQPDFYNYYTDEVVRNSFDDNPSEPFVKTVIYFDIDLDRVQNPDVKGIEDKFKLWLNDFEDDFSIYQKAIQFLTENSSDFSQVEETLESYLNAFFFLSSSRMLFNRYLNVMDYQTEAKILLEESVELNDRIRKLITNYKIFGKISVLKISECCSKLLELEPRIIETLKKDLLVTVNH
ncbi:hypothetical protein [Paenibacillus sp. IHBB 10380]|uniref:hypothetical protein n=1 Tax=Paenibacillus sp. IHBB 10380 TaxID=1566358 RepID=UPI0005CFA594|nr:hypothetical protein [Paenibacillus sp. IHBB 10380]AJS60194.1 hypothetical protein UB51_18975 [Paenibacillus sp. IHBB 10380]